AVTTPDEAFTVATEVLLLLHVPPAVPLLVYCAVCPTFIGDVPLTVPAVTFGLTARFCVAVVVPLHPVTEYVMLVVPAATAVTTPVALTVATEVFELLQLPPAVPVLLYCAVAPTHNGDVPFTVPAVTFGLTVSVCLAVDVLQVPVTV